MVPIKNNLPFYTSEYNVHYPTKNLISYDIYGLINEQFILVNHDNKFIPRSSVIQIKRKPEEGEKSAYKGAGWGGHRYPPWIYFVYKNTFTYEYLVNNPQYLKSIDLDFTQILNKIFKNHELSQLKFLQKFHE